MLTIATLTTVCLAAPQTFDLSFDGGTVSQWVEAIKAQAPEANIYVSAGINDSIMVGPMHFHDVTVHNVMQICGAIPGNSVDSEVLEFSGSPIWVLSPSHGAVSTNQARASRSRTSRSSVMRVPDETVILPVPEAFRSEEGSARIAEILANVTAMGHDSPPTVHRIKGTDLLVLRGLPAQIETGESLLFMLGEHTDEPATGEARAIPSREVLREQLTQLNQLMNNTQSEDRLKALTVQFRKVLSQLKQQDQRTPHEHSSYASEVVVRGWVPGLE